MFINFSKGSFQGLYLVIVLGKAIAFLIKLINCDSFLKIMIKVGLEIHGYINTKEKLFCTCKAVHGTKLTNPNTNICPICTGQPGAKPMLPNKEALDKAIKISLILGCSINKKVAWQRKHYSWPDLPKGYQSTLSGPHAIPTGENGKFQGIRIRECHLEEDPAAWNPQTGEIDYNRSGIPLIEIVTEPDFTNADQVEQWVRELITTLGYIKSIDRQAGIKADVNVSVSGGQRVEIKNVNSIKNIRDSIIIEENRQEKDTPKEQETRRYDAEKRVTKKMRSKEKAEDYRFISDPDLPNININYTRIDSLKRTIPETPMQKIQKLIRDYKIPKYSADILTKNIDVIELFEKTIKKVDSKLAIRWITEQLFTVLNNNKKNLEDIDLNPEHFIDLLRMIEAGELTESKAKEILRNWKKKSFSPREIKDYRQISSEKEIEKVIEDVMGKNKQAVEDYKAGKKWAINFLMGKIMEASNKRVDYRVALQILIKKLR